MYIMTKYKKFIQLLDDYNSNEKSNMHTLDDKITNEFFHMQNNVEVGYTPTDNDDLFYNNKETMSNYLLWQQQAEVEFDHSILTRPEPLVNVFTNHCHIDISVNSVGDLIKIIDDYPVEYNTKYNIDLETLHKIKPELVLLNNMIGMTNIKESVIDQLLYFMQSLHVGTNISDFKHTVIYGPPGTGKTEVARIIGTMYSKIGVLKNNVFRKVTRNDLIAGYLGQTAIKTKQVITECLGGVLFIDEAYSLASSDNDSFSKECLDILCETLSDHKHDLMVIIAGYEDELNNKFFIANQGLNSRFIWRFTIQPYTMSELAHIFHKMVFEQEWTIDSTLILNEKWFNERKDNFGNYGRDIEALITYIKVAHGRRIYGNATACKKMINADDLHKGYTNFASNKKKDVFKDYGLYV